MANIKNETLLKKINERIVKKFSTKTTTFNNLIKVGTKLQYTTEDVEDLGYEVYGSVTHKLYLLVEINDRYAVVETDNNWKPLEEDKIWYIDEETLSENVAWFTDGMYWWN